jgi:hypothetical protein
VPADLTRRALGWLKEMSGNIERRALAALRHGGRPEDHIDLKMFQPVGRLPDKMKWMAGLVSSDRSIIVVRELAGKVRGEHGMDRPTVFVIRCPMSMVGVGMNVDQRNDEHPEGKP